MKEGWRRTESGELEYWSGRRQPERLELIDPTGAAAGDQSAFTVRGPDRWPLHIAGGLWTCLTVPGAIAPIVHPADPAIAVLLPIAMWVCIALPCFLAARIRVTLDGARLEIVNFDGRYRLGVSEVEQITFDGVRAVVHCRDGRAIRVHAIRGRLRRRGAGIDPHEAPNDTRVLDRRVEIAQQRALGNTGRPSARPAVPGTGPADGPGSAVWDLMQRNLHIGLVLLPLVAVLAFWGDRPLIGAYALANWVSFLVVYVTRLVARRHQFASSRSARLILLPFLVMNVAMLVAFVWYFLLR